MQPKKTLKNFEDHWVTNVGAWFPGDRVVFRGKDLFHDLKDLSWMGLFLYGITGRIFSNNQLLLFEGLWRISSSYPDPRLWNNRIVALAATSRSTGNLGVSAAIAASEAEIYGQNPIIKAIDFLYRAKKNLDQGAEIKDVVSAEFQKYRGIFGFGRPLVRTDERIKPLMALVNELGFEKGFYVNLVFQIEQILKTERRRLSMNIAALDAALAADQGLSPQEFYQYSILCFTGGMMPCYQDAVHKPAGTFFPLACNRLHYQGADKRVWQG